MVGLQGQQETTVRSAFMVVVRACGGLHGGPHPAGNGVLLFVGGQFQHEGLRVVPETVPSNVQVETVHCKKSLQGPLPDRNVSVRSTQTVPQPVRALVHYTPQVVCVVEHHFVMLHQPLVHRLVHDAGVGVVGIVQESGTGAHGQVNVRFNSSGCLPIIAGVLEGGCYLPTVAFRVERRAVPATPGQGQLQQGLQVGLNLQHLFDEGNQFRLTALLQIRVQFFHRAEGIGLVQPGQQQRPNMLATSTATYRTGTIGLLDPFGAVDNPQAVGLGPGALARGPESAALKSRIEDGPILKVTATELETPWTHPVSDVLFAHG